MTSFIYNWLATLSHTTLNFIFYEVKRVDKTGSNNSKCVCALMKFYGLPRARLISKKLKLENQIRMDEVCTHWTRLHFDDDDDDDVMKDDKTNISLMTEWKMIQERFMKADDIMKFHIKEKLRKIAYPETTDSKPKSESVKTKGAHEKVKPAQSNNSTKQSLSYFKVK